MADREKVSSKRPRLIKPPVDLPPGAGKDLKEALYDLYLRAGHPTLEKMATEVAKLRDMLTADPACEIPDAVAGGAPGTDIIHRILHDSETLSSLQNVRTLAVALAYLAGETELSTISATVTTMWTRARREGMRQLPARPMPEMAKLPVQAVRFCDPRQLGVHQSIKVGESDWRHYDHGGQLPALPFYMRRSFDRELRTAVQNAAKFGGLIIMVGDSSLGKTRSAFEAIAAELGDWDLFQPSTAAEVSDLVGDGLPRRETVLWLDQLDEYIDGPNALTVGEMRRMINLRHPMVIIGTLWPDNYEMFFSEQTAPTAAHQLSPVPTGYQQSDQQRTRLDRRAQALGGDSVFGPNPMRDPYRNARQIINTLARCVFVETFSDEERSWAEPLTGRDPRIRIALADTNFGVTEILSGAPDLVRRWRHGDRRNPASVFGMSVITAAIDARRLGIRTPLPLGFFDSAAASLISDRNHARLYPGWLEEAVKNATLESSGATSPLIATAEAAFDHEVRYSVADYLAQHGGRLRDAQPISVGVWKGILHHVDRPEDLHRAASAARARLHYQIAEDLYRKAAELGSRTAYSSLGRLYLERDRPGDAATMFAAAFAAGDLAAGALIGQNVTIVKNLFAESENAQTDTQRIDSARRLRSVGAYAQALELIAGVSDSRQYEVWSLRAGLLSELGRQHEAIDCLQAAIAAGHDSLRRKLVGLLRLTARTDELIRTLEAAIGAGDVAAGRELAAVYLEQGKNSAALDIYRRAANNGDHRARLSIVRLHMRLGRVDDAIHELRSGIEDGQIPHHELGLFITFYNTNTSMIDFCRMAVDLDVAGARRRLALALERDGQTVAALDVRRNAASARDPYALRELGEALLRWRQDSEAMTVLRQAIDAGDARAYAPLATHLASTGRYNDAIATWHEAISAGQRQGHRRVGDLHERAMRITDARRYYETAALIGDSKGAAMLVSLLRRHDHPAAANLLAEGLQPPQRVI